MAIPYPNKELNNSKTITWLISRYKQAIVNMTYNIPCRDIFMAI